MPDKEKKIFLAYILYRLIYIDCTMQCYTCISLFPSCKLKQIHSVTMQVWCGCLRTESEFFFFFLIMDSHEYLN